MGRVREGVSNEAVAEVVVGMVQEFLAHEVLASEPAQKRECFFASGHGFEVGMLTLEARCIFVERVDDIFDIIWLVAHDAQIEGGECSVKPLETGSVFSLIMVPQVNGDALMERV